MEVHSFDALSRFRREHPALEQAVRLVEFNQCTSEEALCILAEHLIKENAYLRRRINEGSHELKKDDPPPFIFKPTPL